MVDLADMLHRHAVIERAAGDVCMYPSPQMPDWIGPDCRLVAVVRHERWPAQVVFERPGSEGYWVVSVGRNWTDGGVVWTHAWITEKKLQRAEQSLGRDYQRWREG